MAAQTYQLVITGNCANQFVQNVLHYRLDDDGFANRLLAAKGLVDGWLAASHNEAFLDMVSDAYIMQSVKARRVSNGGGPEWIDVSVNGTDGDLGSETMISGAGPVVILYTDGGARRIGKIYLAGLAAANVDGDELTAAAITAIKTAVTTLRTSFNAVGGGNPPCVLCVPRANNLAVRSLIVDHNVSKIVGKQRRRQLPV